MHKFLKFAYEYGMQISNEWIHKSNLSAVTIILNGQVGPIQFSYTLHK